MNFQGDEHWEPQLKFLYLLFPSSLTATSQLPDSKNKKSPLSHLKTLLHLGNHISHLLLSFRPQQNWSMFSIHCPPSFLPSPSLFPLGFPNPISSCCLEPTAAGTTLVSSHYIPATANCSIIVIFIIICLQRKGLPKAAYKKRKKWETWRWWRMGRFWNSYRKCFVFNLQVTPVLPRNVWRAVDVHADISKIKDSMENLKSMVEKI